MSDFLFRMKVLYWLVMDAFGTWKSEVWSKDLDSKYCCDGRECGCGAMTTRDMWTLYR